MKRVGILGGTFDPIHIGHLIIAETVKEELQLEEIWFIPSNEPPHKSIANASVEDRLNMIDLSIKNNPAFKLNTIEIKRKGKSYTINTIQKLVNDNIQHKFYFIIGADMVEYLPNWYKIDELIQLVSFVGVKRSGYTLQSPYPIIEVDIPMVEVSSTFIRSKVHARKSIQYLVPDTVAEYIKERKLYESR